MKPFSSSPMDRHTALVKAQNWCAYQERAQQEVRDKLYEWKLSATDIEQIISTLITDNFLNEERFANAYTSGKFNIKKWGKLKIKQGLKFKQVPDKLIQKALNTIDADDYTATLLLIATKKSILLEGPDAHKRKQQLIAYLRGKGFENDLIFDVLKANNLP